MPSGGPSFHHTRSVMFSSSSGTSSGEGGGSGSADTGERTLPNSPQQRPGFLAIVELDPVAVRVHRRGSRSAAQDQHDVAGPRALQYARDRLAAVWNEL